MKAALKILVIILILNMMAVSVLGNDIAATEDGQLYIKQVSSANELVKEKSGEKLAILLVDEFSNGDKLCFKADKNAFLWIRVSSYIPEQLIYMPDGYFEFPIPKGQLLRGHDVKHFSGKQIVSARFASEQDIKKYRNLALNRLDVPYASEMNKSDSPLHSLSEASIAVENGEVMGYPHAYANRVTRNDGEFYARNAIDGMAIENMHGFYPFHSWSGGKYEDLSYTVYFGRKVTVDKVVLNLRSDYRIIDGLEHDTYWKEAVIEFSDGKEITVNPIKTGQKQEFKFDAHTTEYIRLKKLVPYEEPDSSMYAALSEIEVWGYEAEADKEIAGYIYAYFRGSVNHEKEVQQIHLAISEDGLNWRDLNGNFPVIESTMGTKGLRDPYIIRSPKGDKFYLMATDLDANGGDWGWYAGAGSKSLMFWESEDLVNWSEQRMIRVADDTMGCAWALEAIYDDKTEQYVIYWASTDRTNDFKKSVHYATTKDFITFSEPKVFVDGTGESTMIDTSMIKGSDGRYYRFTKKEANNSVFLEVSDSVLGEYTKIDSNIESITGVEGPAIFQMADGRYCLMLDGYAGQNAGKGFFPLVTDDIASGQFTRLTEGFKMPTGAKHGVMLPITKKEYDAVMEKWGPLPEDDKVYEYAFEGKDEGLILNGNAKTEDGKLVLDGTTGTYAILGKGIFDRRESFTVSMDVLSNTKDGFFFTFAIGDDASDYLYLRVRENEVRLAQTITGPFYEEGFDVKRETKKEWHTYTIVGERDSLTLYIDGEVADKVSTTKTLYHLGESLSVTLGKSTFEADKYFNGSFDNVKIYNRALTAEEIKKD